ncbi:uncharacterized protein LOC133315281 [Gastrolobium bilobum]|uniref:uncharacterized protein LOC133315281 n=1 Tax=Gastrolobium bilobum TaxID=150636 RepID=UPI002AB12385|nr:uncharacterized protein LOC133315281 [Gastrolobium bilobum]
MQCWCLFVGPTRPCNLVISKHATPFNKPVVPSVSATSLPRRPLPDVSTTQQAEELGHTLLGTLQSNPLPIPKQQQQQQKQEGREAQIRGSDVLWALQRASAHKKKKNKQEQRRGSSSAVSRMEESAADYSNVRPLCINNHWGAKLDDLEKRLCELSHTI